MYLVTIRKHQVKDYVERHDLLQVMNHITEQLELVVMDTGYHIGGTYRQLHVHARVYMKYGFHPFIRSYCGYGIHYQSIENTTETKDAVCKYIHSEDLDSLFKKEQLLAENYYSHNYAF